MKRSVLSAIACCAILVSTVAAQPPGPSWRLVRDDGDIAVYTREVAGSRYRESLGRTVVDAPLPALVALILDGDSHSRWIDAVDESRRLGAVSATEVYNYTLSGAPWPLADRDAIVRTRVAQDRETLVVTIQSSAVPDHLPERAGTVRVPFVESSWTLVPAAPGVVQVDYRMHSDPGGAIPAWLINSLASDQPYRTLENLRRFFGEDNDYRDRTLPFIRVPDS